MTLSSADSTSQLETLSEDQSGNRCQGETHLQTESRNRGHGKSGSADEAETRAEPVADVESVPLQNIGNPRCKQYSFHRAGVRRAHDHHGNIFCRPLVKAAIATRGNFQQRIWCQLANKIWRIEQ